MTVTTLGHLLEGQARILSGAGEAVPISGVTADSRKVEPGFLFVAVPGAKADGARFIPDAIARGAAAVLMEPTGGLMEAPGGVAFAFALDVRRALALAAARFYPRQPATIAAITGTAGKTSVAFFLRQIWQRLGHRAAYLGTIGLVAPDGETYGSLTTPDPVELHATLDRLAGEGVTHMALEASSHGLDQKRLDGVRLSAGGFTNLGRDHLDYHPTLEAYFKAKLRLFTEVMPADAPAVAVLSAPYAATALAWATTRGLPTVGIGAPQEGAQIAVDAIESDGAGQIVRFCDDGAVRLPLVGRFQADNALLAAGLAIACGAPRAEALAAMAHLSGVPGRLERVSEDPSRLVFVDYAHKPEALAAVLDTLRAAVPGRLVCVFGCGGDRDTGKRPLMGAIASAKADVVIVTDDNPRSEDPAAIRAAILAAAPGAREIGDRAEAIRTAVTMLERGDALVVAGKGHETGQIIGERTYAFSDAAAVRAALGEVGA
ncbi:UDP-N-acetylmuramoyl-L-alanyl-D-glutamate--2,6-diaminopimelate ligase [Xanthobacter sp. KR7-225]|uniref:UDP-N-acetylmuramoyl-L-alanyl-D-glutamate--2, 6-diaminopimelate ligase n=1 Tax=Xanthobacter sp. KR7-225 TaxID=3156613 RepID=UPI0032B5A384